MRSQAVIVLFLLTGCGGASETSNGKTDVPKTDVGSDTSVPDGCEYAMDGHCDEPVNCAYGTDSTDCIAACAANLTPHLLAGACAYRAGTTDPPNEKGTGGTSHRTGYRDGLIPVPSGEDSTVETQRHYRLYVPSDYRPDSAVPLVVFLPGHRVDHYSTAQYTQLSREAERNGFIVAYAEQEWRWSGGRWAWWTDWNWSGASVENPDLIYLRRLVERVGEQYNLDTKKVYAVGHSRGGAMSIIAGVEMPDVFAGICSQSGFTEFNYHERIAAYTGRKVPMVFVHGVMDPDVCIDCVPQTMGCSTSTPRMCSSMASDALVEQLTGQGWTDHQLFYYRLANVAHRWQPQLNQPIWDYLMARPMPEGTP